MPNQSTHESKSTHAWVMVDQPTEIHTVYMCAKCGEVIQECDFYGGPMMVPECRAQSRGDNPSHG